MMGVVEEAPEEINAHSPPPSLVPRLHAVLWNSLKHINPLVPKQDTDEFATGTDYVMEFSRSRKLDISHC